LRTQTIPNSWLWLIADSVTAPLIAPTSPRGTPTRFAPLLTPSPNTMSSSRKLAAGATLWRPTLINGLALAEAIGARCCVEIAGSRNPTSWFGPHPDNFSRDFFDTAVENARKIIDAVKPRRTAFAYEMMGWAFPDTPEHYVKLIKAVDRKGFAVHLDPCNVVNSPEKFYRNTDVLNECFDKLGKWIASCHAKDLTWDVEMNVHFREVIPGKGSLDYTTYLRRLAQLPQNPPLMLEHLSSAADYATGREHIMKVGVEAGLSFG
jgi:sugar phosphate isomerase/epimerase